MLSSHREHDLNFDFQISYYVRIWRVRSTVFILAIYGGTQSVCVQMVLGVSQCIMFYGFHGNGAGERSTQYDHTCPQYVP